MNRRQFLASIGTVNIGSISGYAAFQNHGHGETGTIATTSNLETPRDFSIQDNQKVTIPIESFIIQGNNIDEILLESRIETTDGEKLTRNRK